MQNANHKILFYTLFIQTKMNEHNPHPPKKNNNNNNNNKKQPPTPPQKKNNKKTNKQKTHTHNRTVVKIR